MNFMLVRKSLKGRISPDGIGTLLLNERSNSESGDWAIPEADPGTILAQ